MPVRLHHIVIDAHDQPGLAGFWTQALGWKVLSERENEIVIGTDENALAGICFMPVTEPKAVKNRLHLDLASGAARRLGARLASFTGMTEALFAAGYAWLLLGQRPAPAEFAGGALMLAGVVLVRADENRGRPRDYRG